MFDIVLDNKVIRAMDSLSATRLLEDFRWEVEELGYEIVQESPETGEFIACKPAKPAKPTRDRPSSEQHANDRPSNEWIKAYRI